MDKISASWGRALISKLRSGRRPISVHNLLKREREGMYFKKHSAAYDGPDPLWLQEPNTPISVESKLPAKHQLRKPPTAAKPGEVPSSNISGIGVREEDGRSNSATVLAGPNAEGGISPAESFPSSYKLGSITPEQAQKSLDQLDSLEKSKPTPGKIGRYAAVGAVSGPAISLMKATIQGKPYFKDATRLGQKLRHVAGESAAGAMTSGLIPIARHRMDQNAEKEKLRAFLHENQPVPRVEPPAKLASFGGALMSAGKKGLHFLEKHEDPIEVGGLAYLAAPNVDNMQAKWRARNAGLVDEKGHPTEHGIEQKRFIKERFHDPVEATGLGVLAAPLAAGRILRGKWGGHA
jgi:hypothetical protein